MKALWRGYLRLGGLAIPVRLYSATHVDKPQFALLHEKDGSPVERTLRCKADGKEIVYHDTIRAAVTKEGKYVALTGREIERAVQDPKTVIIRQFCELNAVPLPYFDKPYYIVPAKGGESLYALFREVLTRMKRGALVSFVLRNRDHIGLIHGQNDLLMIERLRFASALAPRSQLHTPSLPKPHPQEADMLEAVVERFSGAVYMEDYHDEFGEQMEKLIERKAKGLPLPKAERVDQKATPEEDVAKTLAGMLENANAPRRI